MAYLCRLQWVPRVRVSSEFWYTALAWAQAGVRVPRTALSPKSRKFAMQPPLRVRGSALLLATVGVPLVLLLV